MLRELIAISLFGLAEALAPAQQAPPAPPRSTVFFAQDDQAIEGYDEAPERSRRMVDALLLAVTGQSELGRAWQSLVKPADRVGIKVATAGGHYFSTHRGVVAAVIDGLGRAGIPRDRVVVWDRNSSDLRAAGFISNRDGYLVRAIDPPGGFDRDAQIAAPALGKLMWGDLLFQEKQRRTPGKAKEESDQLSSTSHLARLVSRDVTKVINIPVLSDERGCGIAGALYNMTVPNVDNWRRFTRTEGPIGASPADLYADERIGPKVVLHIMDGLIAQYAGGPGFNPNYAFPHQTLYASKDPVALDATALRKIEEWRKLAKLPSLAKAGEWLETASQMGLGNAAEIRITQQPVTVPR